MKTLGIKENYLGIPKEDSSYESSAIAIVPVPYEATVSYGGGTAKGPGAVITASHYVEFYDEETEREVYKEYGIATLEPMSFKKAKGEKALSKIYELAKSLLDEGKFVVMLGGEHTISQSPIAAHAQKFPDLSVLQFDAHSDLRDSYLGDKYSHASVMARVAEFMDPKRIVQVGIRAQCIEEAQFIRRKGINTFYAHQIRQSHLNPLKKNWDDEVVNLLSDNVYITFDVDGFDPSIMPSTGTPEPNGLYWQEVMALLKKVGAKKKIVGFDVVELAPVNGVHHPDLLTAKLVSKILNYALPPKKRNV